MFNGLAGILQKKVCLKGNHCLWCRFAKRIARKKFTRVWWAFWQAIFIRPGRPRSNANNRTNSLNSIFVNNLNAACQKSHIPYVGYLATMQHTNGNHLILGEVPDLINTRQFSLQSFIFSVPINMFVAILFCAFIFAHFVLWNFVLDFVRKKISH